MKKTKFGRRGFMGTLAGLFGAAAIPRRAVTLAEDIPEALLDVSGPDTGPDPPDGDDESSSTSVISSVSAGRR